MNEGSLIRQGSEMVGVVEPQCPVTCSVPLVTSDSLICPFSVYSLHSLCSVSTLYMWWVQVFIHLQLCMFIKHMSWYDVW